MDKKGLIKYGIITVAIIVLVIIFASMSNKNNSNKNIDDAISRFQWIQMLTEEFGITEYTNATPYFKDVNSDSEYFANIQSAYEWGLLEESSDFKGDEPADGEFIALTAMKAVGKYKVQIYMGLSDEPKSKDYIDLALDKELVTKSQLNKNISLEEGQAILEKASDLYLSKLWVDDYAEIKYQDNVTELEDKDIDYISEDYSQIVMSRRKARKLNKGEIIVFAEPRTGQKIAKQIFNINKDGSVELVETSLDKVIYSLVISDISEVKFEDILTYNNLGVKKMATINDNNYVVSQVVHLDESVTNEGFAISVTADEDGLSAEMTNHNTGVSCELSVEEELELGGTIEATIDVKKIYAGVQALITFNSGVEYVDVQLEADIECTNEISISEEIEIPLTSFPIYLPYGAGCVDIGVNLVISVDGSISVKANLPVRTGLVYENGSGFRKQEISNEESGSSVVANCSASIMLNLSPTLKILAIDVLDLDLDIGVSAIAEIETRTNSEVISCADLTIALPIFTISVSPGEDIEDWFDEDNFPLSWEILTADNTLFRKGLHYEWYSDGTSMLVDECTYGNELTESNGKELLPNNFFVWLSSPVIDKDGYYEVKGDIFVYPRISASELRKMEIGDEYHFYNMCFTYIGKRISEETGDIYHDFEDKAGNKYFVEDFGGSADYPDDIEIAILAVVDKNIITCGFATTNIIIERDYKFVIEDDEMEGMLFINGFDNYEELGNKIVSVEIFGNGMSYDHVWFPEEREGVYINNDTLEIETIIKTPDMDWFINNILH